MARTLKGNFTGKAAQLEKLDQAQARIDQQFDFQQRWYLALNRLKELDPTGWEAWYDRQPEQTCKEMLPKIEELVKLLEVGK